MPTGKGTPVAVLPLKPLRVGTREMEKAFAELEEVLCRIPDDEE